jgi:hypothetical protein
MSFGVVLTVILVGYALYYGGMVLHDMLFAGQGVVTEATMEEEEIDISDEARGFQSIVVNREKHSTVANEQEGEETTSMNGAVDIDDLVPMVNDLATKGENSELAAVCASWSVA